MSRRERIMLICLAIFAIIAVYYYFFYQPIIDKIAFLEQEKVNYQEQINKHIITLSKKPEVEARYAELKYIENEDLANRIGSIDEMLQVLENESDKSGIEITSFVPNEQEKVTMINMVAEGKFSELVLFLEGIKVLNGQIEFKSISVDRKNEEDDLLVINAEFIYHYDLFIGGDQT